ncbi:DUF1963 domain-containing protein [Ktedonobacter racemifer]|uniref:DUF1963 domain-containing protein n=1 Tax=Ktedonobacter racemifer DSM 44963 TaxID=485913 RepID=D6TC67_KTERA|nr:DUF1963 domain-containing protein [Ktedonobacter racemifer]EFH88103.1 conserved hypothetical protein [Ktedonobacter racemifer DSM 44963]
MRSKYTFFFEEVQQPITKLVTKFGGQPTWLTTPQWPLSRQTGKPMRFVCQIALDPTLFGEIPGRMAYLFITHEEGKFVDDTYDPDGGENAVIIQPGTPPLLTQPLLTGPSLYKRGRAGTVRLPCECAVQLSAGSDPDEMYDPTVEGPNDAFWEEVGIENKIGGTPVFLQMPEYPAGGHWRLLLQLEDSTDLPFYVNFGGGVGYAFLSEDGTSGKFLFQC